MTESTPPAASAAEFWDDMYSAGRKWSGRPNVLLVPVIGDEPASPGARALDLGSGEGADAMWLASNGWDVLGVDVSEVALARAREHAAQLGVTVRFEQSDLDAGFPAGGFDLVTASYLHSTLPFERDRILRSAWAAVAPGGRLVILSHAEPPSGAHGHHVELPDVAQTIALLQLPAAPGWSVSAGYHRRSTQLPDGRTVEHADHVVVVTRDPAG
ncbi:class I SAM-dependent methyltransferase [Microbacteriaceae bacterium VKM Ac-2854]|nr:class I SAM-dependent methyltransferase [Microbacteriaceae bacterium VKM Ac-2854]